MDKYWYDYSSGSKEFKLAIKKAPLYQLRSLLGVFGKKQKQGEKVSDKIVAIRKEMVRRKK
ncbi:hypothetical protein [Clostridium kluyveri]|uniref:Uncharacterized protein n=1 Tax=Clostridium kluyveri (strain ATCC 8527 / DSM 555 / NBRC 12016 / NCIMB 10680 / K1) TaxID=431943 RepID=A5F9N4_CLOK5|nr:hypothetical protein [Clostridium kluyveri]ABQ23624.1 hypothetical protein CKL_4025 [Clostridium kluyveri DSM 555]